MSFLLVKPIAKLNKQDIEKKRKKKKTEIAIS